jgi:hypothetical protein
MRFPAFCLFDENGGNALLAEPAALLRAVDFQEVALRKQNLIVNMREDNFIPFSPSPAFLLPQIQKQAIGFYSMACFCIWSQRADSNR